MTKIILNINTTGRPTGATKAMTKMRNGYIVKAYRQGFRRRVIADMMGLSYNTVCAALKAA